MEVGSRNAEAGIKEGGRGMVRALRLRSGLEERCALRALRLRVRRRKAEAGKKEGWKMSRWEKAGLSNED